MIEYSDEKIEEKLDFIRSYISSANPASGSKLDSNANVTKKSITTLSSELAKDMMIQINRKQISEIIREEFGAELSAQYIDDIESHNIYVHDESSLMPYCVSVNMYPFLLSGMAGLGNQSGSDAPKHLRSFCGSFVNLVQYIASQFAGAVATVEFLMYFDYFARKDYGNDYLKVSQYRETVEQELQGIVYLLNQDSAARGGQSVFWNISTFDEGFFNGMFGEFVFPDMTAPDWESLDRLQRFFHDWFRKEREKKLLTFPVVTHSAIVDDNDWVDERSKNFIAYEMSQGGEFFIYTSKSADSLSSCCRLRNELADNTFSYSLGAGGVATGSKNVVTINMNRVVQKGISLVELVSRVHRYQVAHNIYLNRLKSDGMLPVYDAQYITLDKQYLTIGINGLVEAAEFLGFTCDNNDGYKKFLSDTLGKIKILNKIAGREYGVMFNTELVPAENLGVKNAKWDSDDGLAVTRDCYNSYFYPVEDETIGLFNKMEMHGGEVVGSLDGGSALHYNNDERLTYNQYKYLLRSLARTGCNYFCENVKKTVCNSCGHIHANTREDCVKCGSTDVDYATRIIGYLKLIKNFSESRQVEEADRSYEQRWDKKYGD